MKDFDTERRERHAERERMMGERSFVVGGETFYYRAVVSYTVLESIAGSGGLEGAELIHVLERGAVDMLEDGQEERFLAVLRNMDDPLSFNDLNELCFWLTEAQSGRPTLAPLPSTAGDATTSTSSTDDSSSLPAAASVA
jgi:hypothetical protein